MAAPSTHSPDPCTYRLRDSGIHEVAFENISNEAVTRFFLHLNSIFDGKTRKDPRLLILVDGTRGTPPLGRLMTGARDLVARHPDRPMVRYAFIFESRFRYFIAGLEQFIKLFRSTNEVRTFGPDERREAEAWLLRDAHNAPGTSAHHA